MKELEFCEISIMSKQPAFWNGTNMMIHCQPKWTKKSKQLRHPMQSPSKKRRSTWSKRKEDQHDHCSHNNLSTQEGMFFQLPMNKENKATSRRFHQPIHRSQTKMKSVTKMSHWKQQWKRHSQKPLSVKLNFHKDSKRRTTTRGSQWNFWPWWTNQKRQSEKQSIQTNRNVSLLDDSSLSFQSLQQEAINRGCSHKKPQWPWWRCAQHTTNHRRTKWA